METIKTIFTLKAKLVFLFLIIALAPIAVVGVFSINITEHLIENLVLRQLESAAADKAAILQMWLEERKADLQVIAGSSILKSMNPEAIEPYLGLIQTHYGVYKSISVVSLENEIVTSTNRLTSDIEAYPWDRNPQDQSLFLSDISYHPEEKESAFHIAAPVIEEERCLGTVYGKVGTKKIIYIILQVALGKTGECYLVDKNGTFLAHKEPKRILAENISQSGTFRQIFGNRDRKKTYLDYRNIEVLGTSQKVGGTDWYLVVEQDRDEAFKNVETLKRCIYFTIFLAISSALAITWIISHHVVRPICALSQSAHILATEKFNIGLIHSNRQDEIGVLIRSFADMAQKIQERQDRLKQEFNLKAAELKETDQTLQQFKLIAERSEKFAALGRLGAAVAHEIRTPLTSLKLFMESVQDEIEISAEYAEDFSIAMGQIARIEAATNRLLDFTKPKDLIFSTISITETLNDIVSMVRPLANKQECLLKVTIEDGLPDINADRTLLEEALVNLLINSLEAMPRKGEIVVTVTRDHLDSNGKYKPCVKIAIRDTGHGIPNDQIKMIFDPFFTTKASGTGLGLPLVLNTIKRHGGEIRARRPLAGGTEFALFLPINDSVC